MTSSMKNTLMCKMIPQNLAFVNRGIKANNYGMHLRFKQATFRDTYVSGFIKASL